MTYSEDGTCAPPVFEGDPEVPEVSTSFPWQDLIEGTNEYCVEKDANNVTRWKPMSSNTKGSVSVSTFSRSLEEKGGLSEFLIRGSVPAARDTYFCCNADMEYRPDWDETCVSLSELSSSGPDHDAGPFVERSRILHWNVNYPWPLGKRDYVLEQRVLSGVLPDGRTFRCTNGRTVDPDVGKRLKPSEKGVLRIEDYSARMAIWSQTEQESCFVLLYFEDAKLSVPNWVLTKAAATTIPAQLASFVPVVAKYPRQRLQHMLTRFGITYGISAGEDDNDSCGEAFFSASDNDSPKPPTPARSKLTRTPRSPVTAAASKIAVQKPPLGVPQSPVLAAASKVGVEKPPLVSKKRVSGVGHAKDRKIASKLESAIRLVLPRRGDEFNPKEDSDEDLEEGVLIVGKEERDLLLNLLAEARAKQSTSWFAFVAKVCCSCGTRCGHRRRHKQ